MKRDEVKVGMKVCWRKAPEDVYTVEQVGVRHPLAKPKAYMAQITNVHGHRLWVTLREIYPYVEAQQAPSRLLDADANLAEQQRLATRIVADAYDHQKDPKRLAELVLAFHHWLDGVEVR